MLLPCAASGCSAVGQLAGSNLAAHLSPVAALAVAQRSLPDPWLIVPLALVIVVVYVVIPLVILARPQSVAELDPEQAALLYADALADALGVDQAEVGLIPQIIEAAKIERHRPAMQDIEVDTALGPVSYAKELKEATRLNPMLRATATIEEWWDGSGRTGAPPSLLAKTIALAESWAMLTAAGGPTISHEEALYELGSWAGTRYDPEIVNAAAQIVRRERRFTKVRAFRPRMHRLRRLVRQPSFYPTLLLSGAWALLEWGPPPDTLHGPFLLAGSYPRAARRPRRVEESFDPTT